MRARLPSTSTGAASWTVLGRATPSAHGRTVVVVDRHQIWRDVARLYEELRDASPEGYEPEAVVFLAGRNKPMALGGVVTSRDARFPWVRFTSETAGEGGQPHPTDFGVFVREEYVERVEVRLRPTAGHPIGFSHTISNE